MTQLKDFHQQFVIDTDETVYSEAFDLSTEVVQQVSATAVASSWVAGAVLITPQRSFDGENWADVATAFSSITEDGVSNTTIDECQPLLRFKVASSSSADVTIDIYAIISESAGDGGGTSGGATEAKQDAQTAILTTIDTDTGNIASSTSTISSNIIGMRNEVASEAKQDVEITALGTINTTLGSQATATKQDELKSEVVFIKGEITSIKNNTGGLSVIHSHKNDSFTTTETRDFGASAKVVSIFNDGLGDINVAFSTDNTTFTSEFTLRGGTFIGTNAGEAVREQLAYRYARFTHTGTNSKYRVVALA